MSLLLALIPLLLVSSALTDSATAAAAECRMAACATAYHRTMEYEGLAAAQDERYCQLLATYRACLRESGGACRGNLQFHSDAFYLERQWTALGCGAVVAAAPPPADGENRCHLMPSTSSPDAVRHCAFWGDPHLRTFDGRFHACELSGATPLVDNRYFLVQVSSRRVREDSFVTAVSKVTVIVRRHNCTTEQLRYEASAEAATLPVAFVDGTTQAVVHGQQAVQVLRQEDDHVEIALRHADSTVLVRRRGPYLSVAIRMPSQVVQATPPSSSAVLSEQLCHSGCRRAVLLPLPAALANPSAFSACHRAPLHVPIKLAAERCKALNATDDYFDSCVFDLMVTGDEQLAAMSRDSQTDMERALTRRRAYSVGRVDISPYEHLARHTWSGCAPTPPPPPASSTIRSAHPSTSAVCVLIIIARCLLAVL